MKKTPVLLTAALMSMSVMAQDHSGHYMQTKAEKFNSTMTLIGGVVFGGLDHRGATLRSGFSRNNFRTWKNLGLDIEKVVAADECELTSCEVYTQDYAVTTKSNLSYASKVLPLIDGPQSFDMREKIINEATESIFISTWAIYDDETGEWLRDKLLNKLKENPNIDIRLIVDAQVSSRDHHFAILQELKEKSEGKIQTLHWRVKKYRVNGNHRKFMVVDGKKLILGGMNFGNVYSHLAGEDLWRDTDIYIEGSASVDAHNLYANVWNEQVANNKKMKTLSKIALKPTAFGMFPKKDGDIPVVINDHNPGTKRVKADRNITTGIVKLISEATTSVDIENAYFIMTPPFEMAIKKALDRGVRVRILTNSETSVDEAVVSYPIVTSAVKAAQMGAEVYLKQGSTLHSKYLVVDNKISMVGSYNFHPRSYRYEGETAAVVFDEVTGQSLVDQFEIDISQNKATNLVDPDNFEVKDSFLAKLARNLFFDQL